MEILYKTKLPIDVINIIIKYNDFSIDNFKKKSQINPINHYVKLYTIEDILMKCVLKGYKGFYVSKLHTTVIDIMDKEIKNKNMINRKICRGDIFFYLNFIDSVKLCIDILLLDVLQ
jgi:hypothetical protein